MLTELNLLFKYLKVFIIFYVNIKFNIHIIIVTIIINTYENIILILLSFSISLLD